MDRPIIWNYGGGVQSVAIGVLIAQGKLPMPERAVIADTGREAQSTWDYMRNAMQPLLDFVGLTVEIASHSLARVDMYPLKDGIEGDLPLIPAYTENGALGLFCSGEWKRAVVNRWLASPERGFGQKNPVVQWIGYSRDEKARFKTKKSPVKWIRFQYPLVESLPLPLNRAECKQVILNAGLPLPVSSSCWLCPYRTNESWRHLRDNYPQQFNQAVLFDEEMRERDKLKSLYLHRDRVPLSDVNLEEKEKPLNAFYQESCLSGYCFI